MVECQAYETVVKAKASATDRANTEAAGVYEAIWHLTFVLDFGWKTVIIARLYLVIKT